MKRRCNSVNSSDYKYYGGKGIAVCEEWSCSFESFREWSLNNGYTDDLTIDRINVNGDYCPENCRWISMKEQCNNRSNSKMYWCGEESHTISQWSEILNIPYNKLYHSLHKGNTIENMINTQIS